jgi:hypothetical protein
LPAHPGRTILKAERSALDQPSSHHSSLSVYLR